MQQAETQHITRSRISIPRRRADLLTRQRLLDAMDELLDKKIILINAPAGYGKTSLLIDLADDLALPICWYALDTLDQNLPRFLEYLVAAIQVRFPDFNTSLINVLRSSTQKEISIDTAVSILSNDIYDQITEHFIIMLDDYHLIKDDPQVNQFLSQFVQQTEENCHIIFASRSLLNLPDLPLLVARGLVGGLDQLDLAFNSHETRDLFFFQHHIVLSDDEAEVLQKQTEGWVTGLLLTARTAITRLIPKQKELRATGVNINDYFDLIYNAQSETVQQFLLYTSLLEDFNASLFANTIGVQFPHLQDQYQTCVDHILTSNLFVQSIQMDELSLRYHHLFLDYLQNKFKLEENALYLELQILIAGYYEETQQWEQAYQIYEQEGMLDRQVEFMEKQGAPIVRTGLLDQLSKQLQTIPNSVIMNNPNLSSLNGIVLGNIGDQQNSIFYLDHALSICDESKNFDVYASILVRLSYTYRNIGNYDKAIHLSEKTINLYKVKQTNNWIYAEANRNIGICYLEMSNPELSLVYFNEAIKYYESVNYLHSATIIKLNISSALEILENFLEAEEMVKETVLFWRNEKNSYWLCNALNNCGVIQHYQGNFEGAIKNLEEALQIGLRINYKRLTSVIYSSLGDLYSDISQYDEAEEFYIKSITIARSIDVNHVAFYAINGMFTNAITQFQVEKANQLFDKEFQIVQTMNSDYHKNIHLFNQGVLSFYKNEYVSASFLFNQTLEYFTKNKNKFFIVKNLIYITLCAFLINELTECQKTLDKLEIHLEILKYNFPIFQLIRVQSELLKKISKIYKDNIIFSNYLSSSEKHFSNFQKHSHNIRLTSNKINKNNPLQITTLGSMKVKYNNKTLSTSDWQTQSARDFFFLMLSNPAGFTKEEIGLLLWPDDTLQEFRYHFRNAIYRVRHAIGKESILLEGDIYRFNSDQDFMLDAHEFEQDVQAFLLAESAQEKQKHYKRASKRYKGPYLPGMDLEIIRLERERLQALYRQMTLELCQFTFRQEDFDQTVELANQVLLQDPCNEEICRLAMKAESARGNRAEIARIFERCENALLNEYDAQPTEQTRKLYRILMRI